MFDKTMTTKCALFLSAVVCIASNAEDVDYLKLVRAYADVMIERGRDTYGNTQSPLFACTLDRKTIKVFEKMPPNLHNIRNGDRVWDGANPMHDENLYQILYSLSRLTGESRYAQEADAALKWFFEKCQSPKGLMAWGEHQGWSFLRHGPSAPNMPHEFYRPWVLWERCESLAPEACHRFAVGLWEHQIGDHEKGLFSRHAEDIWDTTKRSGRTGHEFPRHGGFYIAIWATHYKRTQDSTMLKAIESLVDSFQRRRDPKSGAIPYASTAPSCMWPQSNVSLAVDLWDGADKVPAPLAQKMRECAAQIDETFLKIPHEPRLGGAGFVVCAITPTLSPQDESATRPDGTKIVRRKAHAPMWDTGYGVSTNASIGMVCFLRYNQNKSNGYKRLILDAAEAYLNSDPKLERYKDEEGREVTPILYPGAMAEAIALQLAAYRLTGRKEHLERADHFARQAVRIFLPGDSPLPRVSSWPGHDWYEAITRGDTMMMELLELWVAQHRPGFDTGMVWTDR